MDKLNILDKLDVLHWLRNIASGREAYHVACHDILWGEVLEGGLQSQHLPEDYSQAAQDPLIILALGKPQNSIRRETSPQLSAGRAVTLRCLMSV